MEYDNEEEQEESPSGINQIELLRSYGAYVARAVRKRRVRLAVAFVLIAGLTAGIVALLPPTYHCEMKLTAIRNQVFEDDSRGNILGGAREIVMRRESLVALIKRADLVKRWDQDRAPILRFKDRLMARVAGAEVSDNDKLNMLVYAVGQRLSIQADDITLTIGVDWPGAETAARIVDATEQIFLEARHGEEISTIQERITILDQHAGALREEIDTIAEQLEHLRQDKLAQAAKGLGNQEASGASSAAPTSQVVVRRVARPSAPDEETVRLKEELDQKKKAIVDLEADRARRLVEAEGEARRNARQVHAGAPCCARGRAHHYDAVARVRAGERFARSRRAPRGEPQRTHRQHQRRKLGSYGGGTAAAGGPKADVLPSEESCASQTAAPGSTPP